MQNNLLQTLIDNDFGYKHESSNWGRSVTHSSLVVDEEAQKWYWNSEEKRGNALDYLILVRGLPIKKAKELLATLSKITGAPTEDSIIKDSVPYEKLIDIFWEFGKDKRDYWYTRKLTDKTIDRNKLGYFDGWSTIPLSLNGRFVNFQCRRDEPSKSIRYWYDNSTFKPVLLNPGILQLVDTVYIPEGAVDSLLLNQEGLASVASTGGAGYWNPEWYPLFSRIKQIYYIADNDKAGDFGAIRVAKNLGEGRVKVFKFADQREKYDTGDFFKDGGKSSELKELIENESKYIFEIGDYQNARKRSKVRKTY